MAQHPTFPDFKELGIEDKAIFDECFRKYPPTISEFTFTNLFMWRHYYNFKWAMLNDNITIIASPEEESYFFPPIGSNKIKETVLECINYSENIGFGGVMKRVPENVAKLFSDGDTIKIE
ncbi:MAG: phosphatidylglycerol lysyltransferase domain-containing protein, partial [Promethearchaeota archaeon]